MTQTTKNDRLRYCLSICLRTLPEMVRGSSETNTTDCWILNFAILPEQNTSRFSAVNDSPGRTTTKAQAEWRSWPFMNTESLFSFHIFERFEDRCQGVSAIGSATVRWKTPVSQCGAGL